MTKMLPLAFLMLAACAATTDREDDGADTHEDALQVGAGGTVKSQGDLEADGYTCKNWGGTTVTECTKYGSPTYTCDSAGRCAVLNSAPPPKRWPPIVVSPAPTLVAQ